MKILLLSLLNRFIFIIQVYYHFLSYILGSTLKYNYNLSYEGTKLDVTSSDISVRNHENPSYALMVSRTSQFRLVQLDGALTDSVTKKFHKFLVDGAWNKIFYLFFLILKVFICATKYILVFSLTLTFGYKCRM